MRGRLLTIAMFVGLFLGALPIAMAAWSANGSGSGQAKSATIGGGNAPTVTVSGSTMTVSWAATNLSNGVPVSGYVAKRYDSTGTTQQTIASGTCTATVSGTSCSETAVPMGTWRYSVTPKHGGWTGAESAKSSVVVPACSQVSIANFQFTVANITIDRGCSVTWTQTATTKHSTTSDTGAWDSNQLSQNQTFTRAFNTSGSFSYHCMFHSQMVGTITVR